MGGWTLWMVDIYICTKAINVFWVDSWPSGLGIQGKCQVYRSPFTDPSLKADGNKKKNVIFCSHPPAMYLKAISKLCFKLMKTFFCFGWNQLWYLGNLIWICLWKFWEMFNCSNCDSFEKIGRHKNATAWHHSSRCQKKWQLVLNQKSSAVPVLKIIFEQFHF
jgi:hypothetical protein